MAVEAPELDARAFPAVLDDVTEWVAITRLPDGNIVGLNRSAAHLLGLPPEEVVGGRLPLSVWTDVAQRQRLLDALDAEGRCGPLRAQLLTGDGRRRSVEVTARRATVAGQPTIVWVGRDVADEPEAATGARTSPRVGAAMFRALVQRSADAALVLDDHAMITFASPAVRGLFGYTPDELVGRSALEFVHPDDLPDALDALQALVATPGPQPSIELRVLRRDQSWGWVEDAGTNLLDEPAVHGLVLNLRDISRRRAAQDALRASEERYRTIVETAHEGVLVLDLEGRIVFVNPHMCAIAGRPAAELCRMHLTDLLADSQRARLQEELVARDPADADTYEQMYDLIVVRPDGEQRWVSIAASPVRGQDGAATATVAMTTDTTERKQEEAELRRLARQDTLTGLPNRAVLLERLVKALARADRLQTTVALLYLDVDNLKRVNDTWGHAAGDQLLTTLADRLSATVRPTDTVARLGGDEFAILCEDRHPPGEGARTLAGRVLVALAAPLDLAGEQFNPSASIGLAWAKGQSADELLAQADADMYTVKRARAAIRERPS